MHRLMTRGLIVVGVLIVSGAAWAQMGKGGQGERGMMGGGMMSGGGMGMEMMGAHGGGMGTGMGMGMGGMDEMRKMMHAMSALTLTADQEKKVRLATIRHQKEAIPLLGQIRMAGLEIQELLLADSMNLDKVKAKVKDKYDAAAKLEMSHLALTQEVKKMLTPEQRQQMESMMMRMGPMMESMPMMGGMMGSPSGSAKPEPAPSEAPGASSGGQSESDDPHHP